MSSIEYLPCSDPPNTLFNVVVDDMLQLYNHEITTAEAADAARNLIGFCRIVLEVNSRV